MGAGARCGRASTPHDQPEGGPELLGHGAVEDEVDRAVEERERVHQLSEQVVAALEETPAYDAAHETYIIKHNGSDSIFKSLYLARLKYWCPFHINK